MEYDANKADGLKDDGGDEDKGCNKDYNESSTISGGITHVTCQHSITKGFTAMRKGESPMMAVGMYFFLSKFNVALPCWAIIVMIFTNQIYFQVPAQEDFQQGCKPLIDIYYMIMDVKHEKVLNCVFPIGCETGPFWSTENIGPIIPLVQKHSILMSFHS